MTKSRGLLIAVAVAASACGLVSLVGVAVTDDVALWYRVAGFTIGALLMAGAWLLWRGQFSGAVLVWLSAGAYVLEQLVPALFRNGIGAFSALAGVFYLSAAFRIGLAIASQFLVRARHG